MMFGTSHSNRHGIGLVAVVDGESHQSSTACGDDSVVLKHLTGIHRGMMGYDRWGVHHFDSMAVCQNLVPLVNIKIAGKWMFIPLKMVLIGIDPYPYRFPIRFPELFTTCPQSSGGSKL
jgi:hypothetical protein